MTRDLASIQQAVGRWRSSFAARLIAAAAHGAAERHPKSRAAERQRAGFFNQLNKLFAAQNTHLAERLAHDSASIGRVRTINNWTFTTIPVIVLIAAILLALILSCGRRC